MGKIVKSQWTFEAELFSDNSAPPAGRVVETPAAAPPPRRILTVGDLTSQIRSLLEQQVGRVWVSGEVTNLKVQGTGHIYFTLKDATAQIGCVLFRGEFSVDRSLLQDGRKLTVHGEVTVYEPRGQYQLRVLKVELEGLGALQAAFERLKQKLKTEGLFAPERKRPIPRFARRLGLVTSPTGAAIRDVLHAIKRRQPSLEIVLAPCRVQGDGAGAEVARALGLLNDANKKFTARQPSGTPWLDLILVTRGGGSLEDLWAFNEEVVARAIFNSELPVVSAVGHEIDFTISDFVADLRAATPTAAAELITEGVFGSCQFLTEAGERLKFLFGQQLENKRYELQQLQQRQQRCHPRRKLEDWSQHLDDLQTSLSRCGKQRAREQRLRWQNLAERLARVHPGLALKQRGEVLQQAAKRLREQVRHRAQEQRNRLQALEGRLRLLGPGQVLARGYSITFNAKNGKVVRNASDLSAGDQIKTRLQSGEISSRVEPS